MLYRVRLPLKNVLCGCLLAATALAASGCIFMSDEDRDFYGKGWVKPSELDKPMPHHAIPDPSHPGYYQEPAGSAPTQTAATTPDPEWLVPEQGAH